MKTSFVRRAALILLPLLAACDSLLDVDTSGILTPDDLDGSGPASIAPMIFGVVSNYQEALDGIVEYGALISDEMIASGPFGNRQQVDGRYIQPLNFELTGAVYIPLHQARHLADTTTMVFQRRLQEPAYAEVVPDILAGIALGRLYGGYARVWLAELYCWSILTGVTPEATPLLPDQRMRQALQFLREAEAQALIAGFTEARLAALVGQARAHLWLREYDLAAAVAARVPRDFVYQAEYSQNSVQQYNEVYASTWGDASPIASTVGSGDATNRGNERFEHFDRFVNLNLITIRPLGFRAETISIPVMLQQLYKRQDSEITEASGAEAMLIRAEAAVRLGRTPEAAQLLNDLRSDYSLRVALSSKVELPPAENQLQPLTLTGNMRADLKTIADERARELWLTGDRFVTSRRFRRDTFGIDLFPPVKTLIGGGDDAAFPIAQRELDANPNLGSAQACPAGQAIGSWR
jgi:hypothetical protein